jgi:uncharacterized phage-associated protein
MSLKYKLPHFNEAKAVQIAGFFLRLAGGEMNYMKLVKLMYLVDRTALAEWGRSLTYDEMYALKHGPILSFVLDLIDEGVPPNSESIWCQHISPPSSYEIKLIKETLTTKLSRAEKNLIGRVFEQYGHLGHWELVELLHRILPEWKNPASSRYTITYHEILKFEGWSDEEISSVDDDFESVATMDAVLSGRNINMDEVLAVA